MKSDVAFIHYSLDWMTILKAFCNDLFCSVHDVTDALDVGKGRMKYYISTAD